MHEQQLTELISPILAWHGLELDELDVKPMGKRSLLRITVDGDGPDGKGPLLDDISAAASQVSAALDTSEAVGKAPYTLEVSSRGVSKPLTEGKHFRRNTGRLVSVRTGEHETTGRILSATDDEVVLDVKGKQVSRAIADITKAVVQVEMNPPKSDTGTHDGPTGQMDPAGDDTTDVEQEA